MAQKNNRKRGDWYSEVKNIINELNISLNDEDIKKTTVFEFKKIVKEKTKIAALKYRKDMQRKGKKEQALITTRLNFKIIGTLVLI